MKTVLKILFVVSFVLGIICYVFNKQIQRYVVKSDTMGFCSGMSPSDRSNCEDAVSNNFEKCVGPLLDHSEEPPAFMNCLGIRPVLK